MGSQSQAAESSTEHLEHLVAIAGVAWAGIIQISSTKGPFNLWNVMIGVPLLLLLSILDVRTLTPKEQIAWAATFGFTLTSTSGFISQSVFRLVSHYDEIFPPFSQGDPDWEAPDWYYFGLWVVLSLLVYGYLRLRGPQIAVHPKEATEVEVAQDRSSLTGTDTKNSESPKQC